MTEEPGWIHELGGEKGTWIEDTATMVGVSSHRLETLDRIGSS
jgi:hypothetical protein